MVATSRMISKVAPSFLFNFNSFKQTLEVSCSESPVIVSLYNFKEQSWPVLDWLRKYLKQIALVIIINQDFQFLKHFNIFLNLDSCVGQALFQVIIVCIRNCQKFKSSILTSLHCSNDIIGFHGDMLYSSSIVVVYVFLNLRLSFSRCWFVNRHLHILVKIGNYNRPQSGVFSMENRVIYGPESMEV